MHHALASLVCVVLAGTVVVLGTSAAWAGVGPPPSIPEPATLGLIAAGVAAVAIGARFRKRK